MDKQAIFEGRELIYCFSSFLEWSFSIFGTYIRARTMDQEESRVYTLHSESIVNNEDRKEIHHSRYISNKF